MAGHAFGVIACRLPLRTLVRVVAGQATDPRIVLVETFTEGQAVRLKSNILDTLQVHQFHLHPRAVAGAAKVRQVSRIQLAWIENVGRPGFPDWTTATCSAPGPWHDSQVTPGVMRSTSRREPLTAPVE